MDKRGIEAALKLAADYADVLASAEDASNADTMTVAQRLEALYESGAWVDEWLEQKPKPKRPSNNWTPDSRSRFAQWVAWRLEQAQRRPLNGRYTYQLLDGARIATLSQAQSRSERTVRPLKWMLRYRFEDRLPEVWSIAVGLAGSESRVTSAHTRAALAEWKARNLSRRDVAAARREDAARRHRAKAQAAFEALINDGDEAELTKFIDFINARLDQVTEPSEDAA